MHIKGVVNIEVKDRIEALRIDVGLSQSAFAQRLGMAQNSYSQIKTGKNPVNERLILLVCSQFGVSENWLRTGNGEMYGRSTPSTLDKLAKEYDLDEARMSVIRVWLTLDEQRQRDIIDLCRQIVKSADVPNTNTDSKLSFFMAARTADGKPIKLPTEAPEGLDDLLAEAVARSNPPEDL